jgi:hypothetical protein
MDSVDELEAVAEVVRFLTSFAVRSPKDLPSAGWRATGPLTTVPIWNQGPPGIDRETIPTAGRCGDRYVDGD